MKVLKINEGSAFFVNSDNQWIIIDKFSKDDMLHLLQTSYKETVSMDDYRELNITNEAHRIIYSHLYNLIIDFDNTKKEIEAVVNKEFQDAFEEYTNN